MERLNTNDARSESPRNSRLDENWLYMESQEELLILKIAAGIFAKNPNTLTPLDTLRIYISAKKFLGELKAVFVARNESFVLLIIEF